MKSVKKKKMEGKKVKITVREKQKNSVPKPPFRLASEIKSKIVNAKAVGEAVAKSEAGEKNDQEFEIKKTKIRIVGIGGGGSNIVSEIADKVRKSSFYIANTDYQALLGAPKSVTTFQFGENFTHGLGTGMDPRIGEEAANEEREKIREMLEGQDLVIIVSSLGGGTGSGAAPVFAQISKSLGNLTYGIFTLPFEFEGAKKEEIAKTSLEKLKPFMNALTILPNERVFEVVPKNTPFSKTLSYINSMLSNSLEGLVETIYDTGVINIDFADLRTVLAGNGKMAFLNTMSFKKGNEANLDSFEKAFSSPLYPYQIDKARGLLLNIVAQKDLKLLEVNKILTSVASRIHKDARIIFGVGHEGAAAGEVRVTVLATGCVYGDSEVSPKELGAEEKPQEKKLPVPNRKPPVPDRKPPLQAEKKEIPKKIKPVKKRGKILSRKTEKKEPPQKIQIKQETAVILKTEPPEDRIAKDIEEFINAGEPKKFYQDQKSIEAQFTAPVRKNALQVKKEIEREEREMMEKEKNWDVPAFLRNSKRGK